MSETARPETAQRVLDHLVASATSGGLVTSSVREIAESLGIGRGTAARAIKHLINEGCISVTRVGTGDRRPTTYSIPRRVPRVRLVEKPDLDARLRRSSRRDENGCLLWQGTRNPTGYGFIGINRVKTSAHRTAYQLWVGPIPEGLELDHLCRVRNCIEPTHLEPVTHAENVRRAQRARVA